MPISLLNTDLNLLSKVLPTKLKSVPPTPTKSQQNVFAQNSYTGEKNGLPKKCYRAFKIS